MSALDRALLAAAGLCGLLGVAASAAAAHGGGIGGGGDTLRTAAQFLLFHAPAVIGLVALSVGGWTHGWLTRSAGAAIVVGLVLFSGDLAMRALVGNPLFPMAAPGGGIMLMIGWLLVAATAFVRPRG